MPRGRPRIYDEHQLLDAALAVLWRDGVHGISLNRLADELQVSKPAIAGAIGCKDELIARALARYRDRYGARSSAVLETADTPETLAHGYLTAFAEQQTAPDTPPGCFLALANSECAGMESGPIRDVLDRLNDESRAELVDALERTGADDSAALARYLIGQGIAMSALARNGASRADLLQFAEIAARACRPG